MSRKTFWAITPVAAMFAASMLLSIPDAMHAQDKGDKGGKGFGKGKGRGGAPAEQAKAAGPAPNQMIRELMPNLYLVTGDGGNSTVRVTNEGLFVIDTKNRGDQYYQALREQIRTISKLPVKVVFVTHHHQDHSGNIGNFISDGARVIAQEGLKENLVTYAPAQGKPANPSSTFDRTVSATLGGVEARAFHWDRAHTRGDAIVYFEDLGVVMTGDNVVGTAPNIDFPFGGSGVHWTNQLDEIAKLKFNLLIPGHGEPMTRADFDAFHKKFDTLIDRATQVAKTMPKDQLLANIQTDDIGWNVNTAQWSAPNRLDPFYEELKNR